MSELFSNNVETERRRLGPPSFSTILHVAIVGAVVFLHRSASVPRASALETPPPKLTFIKLYFPDQTPQVHPAEVQPLVRPLDAIVNHDQPVEPQVRPQTDEIKPGGFAGLAPPTGGYGGSGPIKVDTLKGVTASGQHPGIGPVGPTGAFGTTTAQSGTSWGGALTLAPPPGSDVPPKMQTAPKPLYPDLAKRNNIQGSVQIEALVTESGEVMFPKVLSVTVTGYGLEQAAIDAVRRVHCEPALKSGRPVAVIATFTVSFNLT